MCLGIPGRVLSIENDDVRTGRVQFGGVVKEVSLIYVPQAEVGTWVIVHVGFAISCIDETEARQVFAWLEQLAALDELEPALEVP